jgi:hypothetical protein
MLTLFGPSSPAGGSSSRRSFLRLGALGLGGLTMADLLRAQAAAGAERPGRNERAVILIYMGGGPSHIDTYDLKPEAPLEFRGEFHPIATSIPGISICEHLPLQARLMDKLAIIRSAAHQNADHGKASHWMMTGYVSPLEIGDNLNPSCGSIAAKVRGARHERLPAYVCLPDVLPNANAAYLGAAYNPFAPGGDPNDPGFQVRDMQLAPRVDLDRVGDRRSLLRAIDTMRRDLDLQGTAGGYDSFYRDAFEIITGALCRRAFDIHKEDPRLRDRYGRHSLGQSCLLARRLVESGVTFVGVNTGFSWDTHGDNFNTLKNTNLPQFDQAVASLVEDLCDRGLFQSVLVVAYGEFGRTPRVNGGAGRDHWPGAMSVLFSGGGLKMGQVVGATDSKAEGPKTRPVGPQDVLATVYHVLGIDYRQVFYDEAQRPLAILNEGKPIDELV